MPDAYIQQLLDDGASHVWTLGDLVGSVAADLKGSGGNGAYHDTFVLGAAGVLPDYASVQFAGGGYMRTPAAVLNLAHFTLEFLVLCGNVVTPYCITYDDGNDGNHIASSWGLDSGGKCDFAVWHNSVTLADPVSYSGIFDGRWHMVTCTWDGTNAVLYIDAVAQGYQSLGSAVYAPGDLVLEVGGWGNRAATTTTRFTGNLQAVSVFPAVLTASQIVAHYGQLNTVAVLPIGVPPTVVTDPAASALLELIYAAVHRVYPTT